MSCDHYYQPVGAGVWVTHWRCDRCGDVKLQQLRPRPRLPIASSLPSIPPLPRIDQDAMLRAFDALTKAAQPAVQAMRAFSAWAAKYWPLAPTADHTPNERHLVSRNKREGRYLVRRVAR